MSCYEISCQLIHEETGKQLGPKTVTSKVKQSNIPVYNKSTKMCVFHIKISPWPLFFHPPCFYFLIFSGQLFSDESFEGLLSLRDDICTFMKKQTTFSHCLSYLLLLILFWVFVFLVFLSLQLPLQSLATARIHIICILGKCSFFIIMCLHSYTLKTFIFPTALEGSITWTCVIKPWSTAGNPNSCYSFQ